LKQQQFTAKKKTGTQYLKYITHTPSSIHATVQPSKVRVENCTENLVVQHIFLGAFEKFHFRPKSFHVTPNFQK
jgi:hypothetical protein